MTPKILKRDKRYRCNLPLAKIITQTRVFYGVSHSYRVAAAKKYKISFRSPILLTVMVSNHQFIVAAINSSPLSFPHILQDFSFDYKSLIRVTTSGFRCFHPISAMNIFFTIFMNT